MADRESKSKSAAGAVSVSAAKKGPMGHKFARIEIHPASNGFTLKHHPPHEERQKIGDEMRYVPAPDPTETVWGGDDAQKMLDHIGGLLGAGKSPDNKSDKTKSGKMDAADKKGEGKNEEDDDD